MSAVRCRRRLGEETLYHEVGVGVGTKDGPVWSTEGRQRGGDPKGTWVQYKLCSRSTRKVVVLVHSNDRLGKDQTAPAPGPEGGVTQRGEDPRNE